MNSSPNDNEGGRTPQREGHHDRRATQNHRCRKRTTASIKIAALNIRGHGVINPNDLDNKWFHARQVMNRKGIGILVVGEAHMDAERRAEIEQVHGAYLKIYFSKLPNTANAAGIAFALNKSMTNTEGIQTYEVVPGHALLLEIDWHNNERLSILGIYAPNISMQENAVFWRKIQDFFERNPRIRKPDLMLGDCNVVEEAIDRLPMRNDASVAVDALDDLKSALQLEDGWRNTNPSTLQYTFMRTTRDRTKHHARLDRIYHRAGKSDNFYEWKIEMPGIKTDHDMVSVKYTTKSAPIIGRGRWVMPPHILYDAAVKNFIDTEGMKLEETLETLKNREWNENVNMQTEWMRFQERFVNLARERAKIVIPKLEKEIHETATQIDTISNDPLLTDDERLLSTTVLKEKLAMLEQRRHRSTREMTRARNHVHGETISRYWSQQNKKKSPRQPLIRLEIPESEQQTHREEAMLDNNGENREREKRYETNSQKMADMMRDHHEGIQLDEHDANEPDRETAIAHVLEQIEVSITEEANDLLSQKLTDEDVCKALKLSANHKAPGLNGISYEIWKTINARYQNAKAHSKPAFNIIKTLRMVYNEIETFGMAPGTTFSSSWMCPLYKKGDKAVIANYRPISLLNSDYKIMTKALTIKL
ncbi:hypothetical protein C8R42DRAFT_594865, partial [Lentinula raphanica]